MFLRMGVEKLGLRSFGLTLLGIVERRRAVHAEDVCVHPFVTQILGHGEKITKNHRPRRSQAYQF